MEGQDTQKAHFDILVTSTPDVGHHKGQGGAKEMNVQIARYQGHIGDSKQQKENIVGRSPPEIPFFEQATVPYQKVQVKQKVHRKGSKVQVGRDQSPDLTLHDQRPIEIETKGSDNVHDAGGG